MAARKASKRSTKKSTKRSSKSAKKTTRKSPARKSSSRTSTKRTSSRSSAPKKSVSAPARSAVRSSSSKFSSSYECGALVLRLGLGIYFIWVGLLLALSNGYQTFMKGVLTAMSASPALFQLAFIGHLVIGFCLVLGLFTRYAGLLASLVTLIALIASWNAVVASLTGVGVAYLVKNIVIIAAGWSLYYTGSKEMSVDYAL